MTIITAWCRKHWKAIVLVFALLLIGMVLGAQMQGCRRTVAPSANGTGAQDTIKLLDEANDLLREIERRQAERQKAAEGLK